MNEGIQGIVKFQDILFSTEIIRGEDASTWENEQGYNEETGAIWDIANKTQKVIGFDYFFIMSSENVSNDTERQLDNQLIKFYPVFDVVVEKPVDTTTWDADDLTGANKQKVTCMNYFVASATNPAQDLKRGLDAQNVKIYTNFDIVVDNPPNIVQKVKAIATLTVTSTSDPEAIDELLFIEDNFTALGPDDPDIQFAIVRIKPTFSVSDGSSGGGEIVDPGDDGVADADEDLQHFVYISTTFSANETIKYNDVCAIASWITDTGDAYAKLNEKLKIHFYQTNDELNPNGIDTTVTIKDFLNISVKELANLLEYVRISDHYYTKGGSSDEATITYVVNEGNETTRYEHWPFESYAAFKGMYLGCCADGVYVLSGDNDDGEPIEAMINFGKQSFGSANYKRVPYVYASLASDGDVYLQVSYNEDEQYMYPARKVDEYNATARFDLGRGIKANYLTFELYNENGSKFDLRNLWIYLTELSRRI